MYPPREEERVNHANWVLGTVILLGIGATGCGSRSYAVTRTSADPVVSKAPDCDFAILTQAEPDYEEVAILEQDDHPAVTAAEFQNIVRKQVCEVGGDAVVAEVDNQGAYLRGTVLRRKEVPAVAAAVNEPTGEPSVAPSPEAQ
jgi:hypothetical protein